MPPSIDSKHPPSIINILQLLCTAIALFCVIYCSGNAVEKTFEDERRVYLEREKEKQLKKLDDVMKEKQHDPGLGFPVVEPENEKESKMLRHILIYNRLSPPNSLRSGEFSSPNEFYAWLDASPGRGNKIEVTLKAIESVGFPDIELTASRKLKRSTLSKTDSEQLKETITLTWSGLLSVRGMRIEIPVIMAYDAKPHAVASFTVKDAIYTGKDKGYKYEVFARPTLIRWKVGPPVPVTVVINNGKQIRPAIPDGRYRKFKLKFTNMLMKKEEYIQLYIGPLIQELAASPLSYYYGLQLKKKTGFFTRTGLSKKQREGLKEKRADKKAPYFEYSRYWPWTLCDHLEIIPNDEGGIQQISAAIPAVWDSYSNSMMMRAKNALTIDPWDNAKQKRVRKLIKEKVCGELDSACKINPDEGVPSKEQRENVKCGVWPEEQSWLQTTKTKQKVKVRYRIHPTVPDKTPITMVYGFFAGIIDGKIPSANPRFEAERSYYLPNQFMYASTKASNKRLRVICKTQTKVGDTRCCKVRLPIRRFGRKNHEAEFDLIAFAETVPENMELLRYKTRRKKTPRLNFRKGSNLITARTALTERFCLRPYKPGRYKIRFEIVPACRGLESFCDGLVARKPMIGVGTGDQATSLAPKDFQPPFPFSVIVPPMKLSEIKIVVQGAGQGDITSVVNKKWFKIRILLRLSNISISS